MMRRLLFVTITLFLFSGVLGGAVTYNLADEAPYLPGDALYSLQLASEQFWRVRFVGEETAVPTLSANLNSYLSAHTIEPPTVEATAVPVVQEVTPEPTATVAATATAVFVGNQLDDPRFVPFPPDADILEAHGFFPLVRGHSERLCSDCHSGETYKGTPTVCVACHLKDDKHEANFGSDCALCHVIDNWQEAIFDHSIIGTQDCIACHTAPDFHYPGTCRACHSNTTDFRIAFFNHATIGGTDCVVCHAAPANHYPGQCSACHNTDTFAGATFNHTFPIYHGDANGRCDTCHPGNDTRTYTCYACHNQQAMMGEHGEEGIGDIANCVRCHADGREGDGDGHEGDDD